MSRWRADFIATWEKFCGDFDVLLVPVSFRTPFPHLQEGDLFERVFEDGRAYIDLIRWTTLVGVGNLPSSVPPLGLASDDLPVGVQVVSRYGHDLTSIRLAGYIGELMGGYQPPPLAL